jgi:RES domain-containing protein
LITWRLTTRSNATIAFDGEGASRYGGRWNSRGTKLVYCSESVSLAVLENLVHFDVDMAPPLYLYEVRIDDNDIFKGPISSQVMSDEEQSKKYGDKWAYSNQTIALEVPSAVVNKEKNYLLNPDHRAFCQIKIISHGLFDLDVRLTK